MFATGGQKDDSVEGTTVIETGDIGNTLPQSLQAGAMSAQNILALPLSEKPLFPLMVPTIVNLPAPSFQYLKEHAEFGKKQVYAGVFLQKQDGPPLSVISDIDQVHRVGTLVRIQHVADQPFNLVMPQEGGIDRNMFASPGVVEGEEEEMSQEEHLERGGGFALVQPHHRVSLSELLPAHQGAGGSPPGSLVIPRANVVHWKPFDYDPRNVPDMIRGYGHQLVTLLSEVSQMDPILNRKISDHLMLSRTSENRSSPFFYADLAASVVRTASADKLQEYHAETDPQHKLYLALTILMEEKKALEWEKSIRDSVEKNIGKAQRRHFLELQLEQIKKELGIEKDPETADAERFTKQYEAVKDKIPHKETREAIEMELAKLSTYSSRTSEYSVVKEYLGWLLSMPYSTFSEERFHLTSAQDVLDSAHFAMRDVKERILEFIAVSKLNNKTHGKILCLVGPPGVGKTSIATSIASALGREYVRVSVGGLSDPSEIMGHRRTYVGAMPGKIVQSLKQAQTSNPLILIDEIDKISPFSSKSSPFSTLLEIFDPSLSHSFRDHYMDVPVDISNVLFVCTANEESTIPAPLLDRMELIRLSGYDNSEKKHICAKYLIPKHLKQSGLVHLLSEGKEEEEEGGGEKQEGGDSSGSSALSSWVQSLFSLGDGSSQAKEGSSQSASAAGEDRPPLLTITEGAIDKLLTHYARGEGGVRFLDLQIEKICRKVALKIGRQLEELEEGAQGEEGRTALASRLSPVVVDEANLKDFVGNEIFSSARMFEGPFLPPGLACGLAWTSVGGSILYIEAIKLARDSRVFQEEFGDELEEPRDPNKVVSFVGNPVQFTGQLGDVMRESGSISYAFAQKFVLERFGEAVAKQFSLYNFHVHFPEGAIKKDGPSAGITLVSSLLSLVLQKPLPATLGMTGEITLSGKVLKIGGVREKLMAAKREGIQHVLCPASNQVDVEELSEHVREGIKVTYVENYEDVYAVLSEYWNKYDEQQLQQNRTQ